MDEEKRKLILQKISEKTGKTIKQLTQEIQKEEAELEAFQLSEGAKKATAFNRIVASYRKDMYSNAKTYSGIFLGNMDPIDMVRRRRTEAKKLFNENPQEAVERGITDTEGTPLHYASPEQLERMPEWAKKRIGKPLPETDWQKLCFGFIIKDDGKLKETIFRMRGDNANIPVPKFSVVKFNGVTLQSSTEVLERINDAGTTNFTIEKELEDDEVTGMFQKYLKHKIINIDQFEKYCQEHQEFERYIILKAIVTEINPQPLDNGTQIIRVEDETMGFLTEDDEVIQPIVCFLPPSMKINFPERVEVYIIGQPNINERGKSISVYGIYVPKLIRNLVTKPKKISADSTDKLEEW